MKQCILIFLILISCQFPKSEYPATVFAYGQELTPPFTWTGQGTDQLMIIDANGVRQLYHPRIRFPHPEPKPLNPKQVIGSLEQHNLLNKAMAYFAEFGYDAMMEVFVYDEIVSQVIELAPEEILVCFINSDEEYVSWGCPPKRNPPKTPMQIHIKMINQFNDRRASGYSIWFGTGYYVADRSRIENLISFRSGIEKMRTELPLNEKELATPISHPRIQDEFMK